MRNKTTLDYDKYVCKWGDKRVVTDGSLIPLLGENGAKLAAMTLLGLRVPPGFTISTKACGYYCAHKAFPKGFQAQIESGIAHIEKAMSATFGATKGLPLLVAVRPDARVPLPGLANTILNLGLNDQSVLALAKATGNERFAWDCYRRFIQAYATVVLGLHQRPGEKHGPFEQASRAFKQEKYRALIEDSELTATDLTELVTRFNALVTKHTGRPFPQDPWEHLHNAVGAVFASWMSDRAIAYRLQHDIPNEFGTAVNVLAMVFPNLGEDSGCGVAFTRNPITGLNELYGEFAPNALGEEIVTGVCLSEPLSHLRAQMPRIYTELTKLRRILESHFKDMQEFEFLVQQGRLYLLQTRSGKRTVQAALKMAVDMVRENLIDAETAVLRIPAEHLDNLFSPSFDPAAVTNAQVVATGLPVSPGAATGRIYLDAGRAVEAAEKGERILLVRNKFEREDLRGMIAAEGLLCLHGNLFLPGPLSVWKIGKPCIYRVAQMRLDYHQRTLTLGNRIFQEGDILSMDGTSGMLYTGQIPITSSEIIAGILEGDPAALATEKVRSFMQLMQWCSQFARLQVRTIAPTTTQIAHAIAFGATGVGLIRTEHMFYELDRNGDTFVDFLVEMLLAETAAERARSLARLFPYHRDSFREIFRTLKGLPATIRLLDPSLHEYLPDNIDKQRELAERLHLPIEKIARRVRELSEFNPMLGFRGCRLGIKYPEITRMQARAIFEAAALCLRENIPCRPEIMIPMVGFKQEVQHQGAIIREVVRQVEAEQNVKLAYRIGALIEAPRGALTADEIAQVADFLSFGTNDLTQNCVGMSRDDSGSFLPFYRKLDILKKYPFASLDQTGVGQLMEIAIAKGKQTCPDIEFSLCGEQGGDPVSIRFCHRAGLSYVSCSAYRVPTARLAAAQAAIEERRNGSSNRLAGF